MPLEFSCAPEVLLSTDQLRPRCQSHCLDASCMLGLPGGGWFEVYPESHLDKADYLGVGLEWHHSKGSPRRWKCLEDSHCVVIASYV